MQTRQFFDVSFVKSTEEIAIQQKDKRVNFNKEVFQELWQYIRNTGFCMGENLPLDFAEVTDEIVSLLTILPYIHPVLMTDMQRYTERIIGLHLIPEARTFTSQHQLLDEA